MDSLAVGPVDDQRFTEIRHLNMTYSFTAPTRLAEWKQRAGYLRNQMLAGCGLLPMPERTPLNAKIFGRIGREDYTVEKVYFESFPGVYVTGNLYHPRVGKGPFPAVLNTHGHWPEGRMENRERSSIHGRSINFAKQGYVAFCYDMVGYNDSKQFKHKSGDLDSPRQHLWGISVGGLQLWNSIRAVDFLLSLPDVDPKRIACTGASGGGTQTFFLTAADDRVTCSAPVNMISSTMQGGCLCENPPLIRLDTNNMEIGALAAPRPLMLVSATGDWTKLTPEVEYPAIRGVYELLVAAGRLAYVRIDAEHNYNKDSREAVYAWFGRWMLDNPNAEDFKESPFTVEAADDLLVFARDPRPENELDAQGFIAQRIADSEAQIEACRPTDEKSLDRLRKTYGPALQHSLAVEYPDPKSIEFERRGSFSRGDYDVTQYVISRKGKGDAIPALHLCRQSGPLSSPLTLIVHPEGKQALFQDGSPGPLVRSFLDAHHRVLIIDCFNTGEHIHPAGEDRTSGQWHFATYNRTDTSERVQDILTALAWLDSGPAAELQLMGIGDAGLWCLLARAFAPSVVRTVVDAAGFDTTNDDLFIETLFVPCLRRAGDFRTCAALIAPGKLFIHNTRGRFQTGSFEEAYRAAGAPRAFHFRGTRASDRAVVQWLNEDWDVDE